MVMKYVYGSVPSRRFGRSLGVDPIPYESIGYLIDQTKLTHLLFAVITNGALLYDENVRMDLRNADVVLPSLDAGERIHRKSS